MEASLPRFESGLNVLFSKDLVHELDRVSVSQIIVQFLSRLNIDSLLYTVYVSNLVLILVALRSTEQVFTLHCVVFLVSEASGR